MNESNSCILNNIDSCEEKIVENNNNNAHMSMENDLKKPLLKNCIETNHSDDENIITSQITFEELYEECPICFDLLDKTREVCTLECKHQFHLECLIDWYRRPNSNYKCPNCYVHRDIILIENTKKVIPKENKKVKQIYKNTNKKCVIS